MAGAVSVEPVDTAYEKGKSMRGAGLGDITRGPMIGDERNPADAERAAMAQELRLLADQLRLQEGLDPKSYDTQRKAFGDALKRAGIHSIRVTHVGHAAAAPIIANFGKDLDTEMWRHGHWNKGAMSNCYTEGFHELAA